MILPFLILHTLLSVGQNSTENISIDADKPHPLIRNQEPLPKAAKVTPDSLLKISTSYIKKGEFPEAMHNAKEALKISKVLVDLKNIGHSLNAIATVQYYQGNYTEALSFFDQSTPYFNKVKYKKGVASSINNQGAIYYHLGNYPRALDNYKKTVRLNETLNDQKQKAASLQNIGGIYIELKDYANAMKYFQEAKTVLEDASTETGLSQVFNGIGEIYLKQSDYASAHTNLSKSLRLAEKSGDKQRMLEAEFNLGKLYDSKRDFKRALGYYRNSLQMANDIKSLRFKSRSSIAIGYIQHQLGNNKNALIQCKKGLEIAEALSSISVQKDACTCLYKVYKNMDSDGEALKYYERTQALNDSLKAKETADKVLGMEFEKQKLVDSLANVEKRHRLQLAHRKALHQKEKQRNALLVSGLFVLVFAGGLWSRLNYTKKSKARLQVEKDRSEHLLLNILPEEIAEELKVKGYVDAQDIDSAAILFTDFKSFTETASKLSPQELVAEINVCFKAFDAIMERYGIEKIKTIGDAYMAAGGLPKPSADSVKNTILAGLDMQEFIAKRKCKNDAMAKPAFEMRVGIHVGPIVAGIVGVKKFQYDLWGDTVNTASRMESHGVVGRVNISQYTHQLVVDENDLKFEYRGQINARGKGEIGMYFVKKTYDVEPLKGLLTSCIPKNQPLVLCPSVNSSKALE